MALPDLTGQNIENTYQRVIQTDGTNFYDGTGSLVNFGGAVFPYTGSAIISGSLIVTGSTDIQYLTASGLNYPDTDGTEFMVLRTDGNGNLSFDYSDRTNIEVRTIEAVTKGDPLRVVGFNNGQNRAEVRRADALNPSLMPSYGLAYETVGANVNTQMVALGALDNVNTQIAPNDFQEGDILYVQVGGGLTNVRPTGSALIQNVGKVARRQQNSGEILVSAIGRSNDIPNIQPGYAWVGNENWVATAVPTSSFNEDPFPYTGSAAISGSLEVTGDVTIYGTASVNVLITNYESSSIIYSSGSTKFGDSLDDTHIFTGSISVTGSLDVDNTVTAVTGSFSHLKGNSPITVQDPVTFQHGDGIDILGPVSASQIQLGTATIYSGSTRTSIGVGRTPYFYAGNNAVTADAFYSYNGGSQNSPALYLGSNGGGAGRGIYAVNQGIAFSANNSTIAYIRGRTNDSSGNDTPRIGIGVNPSAHIDLSAHINSTRNLLRISGSSAATHAEAFFISSSGNTGIGTWSPNYKLEVVGEVSASTYYGDGSNLTGISSDPFPYTGSAVISGSLEVTGSIISNGDVTLGNPTSPTNLTIYTDTFGGGKYLQIKGAGTEPEITSNNSVIRIYAGSSYALQLGDYAYNYLGAAVNIYGKGRASIFTTRATSGGDWRLYQKENGQFHLNPGGTDFNLVQTIPDSVIFQVDSTDMGVRFPRHSTTSRDAISTPVEGLLIYNTSSQTFNYHNSSSWAEISKDPFPYTGSAVISGSLEVIGPVSASSLDIGNELKINGQAASSGDTRVGIGNITNPTFRQIAIGSVLANRTDAVQIGGRGVGGGNNSVVIGDNAGGNNTNLGIVGIGQSAGRFAGAGVAFMGYNSGYLGGSYSTGVGHAAGAYLRGSYNTSLGYATGVGTAYVSNVSYNTFIGARAGSQITSGSGNVFLGYGAGQTAVTSSNQLIIANNSSSALVTGDFANNTFNISGSVSASTYYGDSLNITGTQRSLYTTQSLQYSGSNLTHVTTSFENGTEEIKIINYTGSNVDNIVISGSDGINKIYTLSYDGDGNVTNIIVS